MATPACRKARLKSRFSNGVDLERLKHDPSDDDPGMRLVPVVVRIAVKRANRIPKKEMLPMMVKKHLEFACETGSETLGDFCDFTTRIICPEATPQSTISASLGR
jgi:hypothetical protein